MEAYASIWKSGMRGRRLYAPQPDSSLMFPSAVPDPSGHKLLVVGLLTGLPRLPLASAFASLNLTSGPPPTSLALSRNPL